MLTLHRAYAWDHFKQQAACTGLCGNEYKWYQTAWSGMDDNATKLINISIVPLGWLIQL